MHTSRFVQYAMKRTHPPHLELKKGHKSIHILYVTNQAVIAIKKSCSFVLQPQVIFPN